MYASRRLTFRQLLSSTGGSWPSFSAVCMLGAERRVLVLHSESVSEYEVRIQALTYDKRADVTAFAEVCYLTVRHVGGLFTARLRFSERQSDMRFRPLAPIAQSTRLRPFFGQGAPVLGRQAWHRGRSLFWFCFPFFHARRCRARLAALVRLHNLFTFLFVQSRGGARKGMRKGGNATRL